MSTKRATPALPAGADGTGST